jgi:hypothetical protein
MAAAILHADRPSDGLIDMVTELTGDFNDYASAPSNRFFGRNYHLGYISVTIQVAQME